MYLYLIDALIVVDRMYIMLSRDRMYILVLH